METTIEMMNTMKIDFIPESWEITNLGSVTKIYDGTHATPKYVADGIPFYSVEHISKNDFSKTKFICEKVFEKENKRVKLEKGDILMTRIGDVGTAKLIDWDVKASFYVSLALIKKSEKFNPKFLELFINSGIFQGELYKRMIHVAFPIKINLGEIGKCLVVIPSKSEQNKIAEILSTWDQAIEKTKNLIDQLQLRKKGLMQGLLTGKQRLRGFDDEWKELKAGMIFENHSDKSHDGEFEVLSATQDKGVIPRSEVGIDIKYDKSSLKNYKKVDAGDFVISLRSFQGGIEYSSYEGLVSPAYTVLKEKLPISKKFYSEYLKSGNFIKRLNSIIYGIRDGKQISYKEFSSLKLWYPPIDEQQYISTVLEIMDKEIGTYKTYLETQRIQKRGLMQELLTGKKRVKI